MFVSSYFIILSHLEALWLRNNSANFPNPGLFLEMYSTYNFALDILSKFRKHNNKSK